MLPAGDLYDSQHQCPNSLIIINSNFSLFYHQIEIQRKPNFNLTLICIKISKSRIGLKIFL